MHLKWGQPGNPHNLNLKWHLPTKEEIDFAVEIVLKYANMAITKFDELFAEIVAFGNQKKNSAGFCKWLTVLKNCIAG